MELITTVTNPTVIHGTLAHEHTLGAPGSKGGEVLVVHRNAMLEIKWKCIYSRQGLGRRSRAWRLSNLKRGHGRGRTRETGGHRACNTIHTVLSYTLIFCIVKVL